ncbi:hypothetical protein Tco_0962519, partial [Tanacetum coccineum]
EDVNEGKHSRTSSSKGRGNDEDMIQELAEEYMNHLEHGKSKGTAKNNTMTTPRPTPFSATTPCAGVFTPFVIISDSDDDITTLPIRPAPLSPDRTPALYGYLLDSGDNSSNEDLSDTAESLHTQSTSASVVHPSPTRSLSTSLVLASQPGKEIPMPLGYRATMNQ